MTGLWQKIISGELKPGISPKQIVALLPELRIVNESDTSKWNKQAKALEKRTLYASTACRIVSLDCTADLTFYDQQLYAIKIRRNDQRSEILYTQMCDAYNEVCTVLGHLLPKPAYPPLAWTEVAETTLAASGLPNDRYKALADANAASGFGVSVYLEWESNLAFTMSWSDPALYIYR